MKLTTKEIAVYAMLGAVMYASKLLMEAAPNIHLLGVFTIAYTVVYRKKALFPIYIYVFLNGIVSGFASWWIPYLYIWAYMALCAAHGFLFGTLYAPAQALLFGLSLKGMAAWILVGLPWDFLHGVSNFFCGILIVPVISALRLAEGNAGTR